MHKMTLGHYYQQFQCHNLLQIHSDTSFRTVLKGFIVNKSATTDVDKLGQLSKKCYHVYSIQFFLGNAVVNVVKILSIICSE